MKEEKLGSMLFRKPKTLVIDGKIELIDSPKVMGILNLTSDSFYDGGKYLKEEEMVLHVEKMLKEGAFIIDIGCQSTRPGATEMGAQAEIDILIPALEILKKQFPITYFSIDTYHANVAETAIKSGAHIINDISGGQFDVEMFEMVAKLKVPYILMHTNDRPDRMQLNPHYENVLKEVEYFLSEQLQKLNLLGVSDVIIDPGFGFGKTVEHNYQLLSQLEHFSIINRLLLVGISRKSIICKPLKINPEKALNGTTALNMIALQKGADILRVHDVKEAAETIELWKLLRNNF